MNVITRFAPSPTGMLHIGNARTALINWLYTKKLGGKFILRIDDTDKERSKIEYEKAIIEDLKWLGLEWDESFSQSSRIAKYEAMKDHLIKIGRLYECYETPEELDVKRKLQLSAHKPPIYDRTSLNYSQQQKVKFMEQGRKPHYRFLMNSTPIFFDDMIKGRVSYDGSNISDPILVREDGSMTYMISSCVDDIESNISHIIRGEDHLTNTAVQIQIFEALSAKLPSFGHLSLVHQREGKISKRVGGFEISSLRDNDAIEAMTINSFFATIGTSEPTKIFKDMGSLIDNFDISKFSKSSTTYMPEELLRLNHKLLIELDYRCVKHGLEKIGCFDVTEEFWLAIRPNIERLSDVKDWWDICNVAPLYEGLDKDYLNIAKSLLEDEVITSDTWHSWTKKIADKTGRKGKELFMPLRIALTGRESGPELAAILPIIGKKELLRRLTVFSRN